MTRTKTTTEPQNESDNMEPLQFAHLIEREDGDTVYVNYLTDEVSCGPRRTSSRGPSVAQWQPYRR